MLRWSCVILAVVIVALSVVEYVRGWTPLEVFTGDLATPGGETDVTVIRLGVAAWQVAEFPWDETIRRFEEDARARGLNVRIRMSILPGETLNSLLRFWGRFGHTGYDAIVAFADEEITPFIEYSAGSTDPAGRSLLVDVSDYLSADELDSFVPALTVGSSRVDPVTGKRHLYELPWMGEVLALNYNRKFFAERGVKVPTTWLGPGGVEDACRKLKGLTFQGHDVAPLSMNFAQRGFFAQNSYIPMLAAFKRGRGVADADGRMDVSSPEAVHVFETLKRWYDAGYISDQAFVDQAVREDLQTQRSAMYAHWQSRGLWAVDKLGEDTIGIAPTPGAGERDPDTGKPVGSLVATYGVIVPRCSPVREQAVRVCYEVFCTDRYGFQSAVAKGFMLHGEKKGGNKMPATKEIYRQPDLPAGIRDLRASLETGYFYPDVVNWPQCSEILVVEFQKYVRGEYPTAEDALAVVRKRYAEEVYSGK
ncbi:MAG TPA: extracellular solute-binding protein [Planctomycetota bacterium]|nr:extracellular solute-binding protein [Planctomycetota bacterium]